ncbi:MAG: LD-carboxypeptidase [Bacteroidales bacterium]|nr:LD-carboxypeptidase [Bacteroidales bacterium]
MNIAIAAPARKVSPDEMEYAIRWLHDHGFESVFDNRLYAVDNIAAGSDALRASIIQEYMDRDDIDAIWMARGGYGSIRIIDKLDFTRFVQHPKPIVGFSDVTVFHSKLSRLGIPSIHASMPHILANKTPEAQQSLIDALTGKPLHYEWPINPMGGNPTCTIQGVIVGGNLSVLCGMLGSNSFPDTDNRILFIEEVDEYIYHVERMMYALKRAGKLAHLKALVVGGLTEIHDNPDPFGKSVEQAIFDVVKDYDYPVVFGFPAGHQPENRAIVFGKEIHLTVGNGKNISLQNQNK